MADLKRTVEILFQADDQVSSALKGISSSVDKLSSDIGAIADPFVSITEGILALDAVLVAIAIGGLTLAFDKSVEFENSVVELRKVLGEGIGTEIAEAEAIRLSEAYGQSSAEILLSAANFKQAGFDINDALLLTKDALDLVIAGGVESERASELIVAALKGFGEEADQASRFVDILNEVSNNYATNVEELATGISKLSPIAKAMGFTMEETAGLITPIIEVFRSGDEAAIALKKGLLSLIDDTKPVAEALATIGVSQFDLNGEMRSGKDIFYDVAEAFTTLEENEKLFLTQQLVGIQQAGRMVTVFDNLAGVTEITNVALGAAGSAAKEVAARLESAEVSVNRFKVSFENLAIAVGDEFRLAAVEAIDGGTAIEQALRDAVKADTFDPIFAAINDFGNNLGTALETIAENLPESLEGVDFSGLVESFEGVTDAIRDLFEDVTGVDITSVEGMKDAIQFVVDSVESLMDVTGGIAAAFAPMLTTIKEAIDAFNDLEDDTKDLIGQILGFGSQLAVVAGILAVGGTLLGGLALLAGALSSGGVLSVGLVALTAILAGPVGISVALGAVAIAAVAAGEKFSEAFPDDSILDDHLGKIQEIVEELENIPDKTVAEIDIMWLGEQGELQAAQDIMRDLVEADNVISISMETDQVADAVPVITADLGLIWAALNDIAEVEAISIPISIDAGDTVTEIAVIKEELEFFVDGERFTIEIDATSNVGEVKDVIDSIPTEKQIEISLQGNIDTEIQAIISSADTAQTAFEWTAKFSIADAEADAAVLVAAFEAAGDSVSALSDSTASMFGDLLENMDELSTAEKWRFQDIIEDQLDAQNKALAAQTELNAAQAEYIRAKSESLDRGDALIQVTATGLQPALQMIWHEVVELSQIEVTAEGADMLLGL